VNLDEITLCSRLAALLAWAPGMSPGALMDLSMGDHHISAVHLAKETPLTYEQARMYLAGLQQDIEVVRANNYKVEGLL